MTKPKPSPTKTSKSPKPIRANGHNARGLKESEATSPASKLMVMLIMTIREHSLSDQYLRPVHIDPSVLLNLTLKLVTWEDLYPSLEL